jgi:hypothetical protein
MTSLKELEGYTYTEYINRADAYKLVQNWPDIFKQLPKKRQDKIRSSIDNGQDPIIHLKKIIKNKSDMIHTKYNFSKNLGTYGRLFPQNPSLASMPREIRNCLANEKYYDIDMRNAHPVLLSQYCKKNNIRCDVLDEYVKNRDNILNQICEDSGIHKEEAKQTFLSILNGGKGVGWQIPKYKGTFIYNFKNEIKSIHEYICRINIEEYKKVARRKDFNKEGTMMNIILCKLEHMVLMNAVAFMTERGYNVDVLVFDGFMVRKIKEITPEILIELQKYIKDKIDYDIEFVEKTMENKIDLTKFADPVDEEKTEITYFKDKEKFEKEHIKILHPSMFLTFMKNGFMDHQCESKIQSSYRHMKTTILDEKNKVQTVSFISRWLNDPNIRLYNRKVFNPDIESTGSDDFNVWRGFHNESVALTDDNDARERYVNMYKDFIYNLVGKNEDCMNYFIAWCANIIQNPAKRSCICLVLYSYEEGAGKNMITKTLEKCIGKNYVNYISDVSNQLFGKHSAAEMDKLLIVLNEVKGKDTYANTDLFKTRITDEVREVELKGKDAMQINNFCSYIINSNNLNSVNAGEKDRRFCVIDCNNEKLIDKMYFKDYEKNINNNPDAIKCIYEYLKSFNIEEVVPNYLFSDYRPRTALYEELVESNTEKEWEFLEEFINKIPTNPIKFHATIKGDDLWECYKKFCLKNNYDISKLGRKRFSFIFKRTIIEIFNRIPEYNNIIVKYKSNGIITYKMQYLKIREYFNNDKKITKQKKEANDDDDDDIYDDDTFDIDSGIYN